VHDAGARWDDLELVERGLAPAQELVALLVALVLQFDVALEGVLAAEQVGDDGVVDDQFGRGEWVDLGGVAAQVAHGFAHGGQVDHAGYAGEVLHQHPRRGELDLHARVGGWFPGAELPDVVGGDVRAVLGPEQVLQEDLQAVGEPFVPLHLVDLENLVACVSDAQLGLRTEGVEARHVVLLHTSGREQSFAVCRTGAGGAVLRWPLPALTACQKPYVRLAIHATSARGPG